MSLLLRRLPLRAAVRGTRQGSSGPQPFSNEPKTQFLFGEKPGHVEQGWEAPTLLGLGVSTLYLFVGLSGASPIGINEWAHAKVVGE